MGDQDHGAGIVVQGVQQGPAAVDVQVVGGLVQNQQVRRGHGHEVQQQPRPLPPGQVGHRGLLLVEAEAELGQARAALVIRTLRQGPADDLQGRVGGVHGLDLVLVEPAHLHPPVPVHMAVHDRQGAGDHLGEGGLARAVDAQEADAVVDVQAQVQLAQDRLAVIAHRRILQPHQGRGQRPGRGGEHERGDPLLHRQGDGLQLGQALQPGLGLGGLGGLGAEPVDEGLQMRALRLLLGPGRLQQAGLLRPGLLEGVIAAGIELQLLLAQVQDEVDGIVQQFPVVADDDRRVRILLQPRLEPQGTFQVEIVGGFVQEQQVRLGKQGRGERHPHPPAAGEFRHGPGEVGGGKAETGQDFRRPGRGAVRVDLDQPVVDLPQPLRRGGVQLCRQGRALDIGGEDGVEEGHVRGRMLLVHRGHAGVAGQVDVPAARRQLPLDQLEQGRLARAVAPHQPDLGTGGRAGAGLVEEPAAPGIEGQVFDLQHGPGNTGETGSALGLWRSRRYKPATSSKRKTFNEGLP